MVNQESLVANNTNTITMSMRELDRSKVIQDVADGKLKPWRAAERLELTTRQIRRLVDRLREHGPQGLVSQRRAKPSNNRLDAVTADRALFKLARGSRLRSL
ncbi:hypothetical protein WK43_15910 [Burkholderia ubonensis]|uniref:Integrase n=1 Tax=Burkholderia ubonensis TaxID=101571 RepID=A0A107EFF9_9BURK|nr:hypothetical protein WK38_31480 [Burkholderia ubonensis]KVS44657.1 hypothetical protein WK37_15180 [Burkholderia ubonensis]KVS76829.1 hypothetical protein WK42_03175 [Burkholderia ubonensis]KVS90128.1 hypothetical protein WK44_18615 [Burkholderia ubonensis]KVS91243.1 hypothetical protein WK43_15910 [Burkholderia ubonensis]